MKSTSSTDKALADRAAVKAAADKAIAQVATAKAAADKAIAIKTEPKYLLGIPPLLDEANRTDTDQYRSRTYRSGGEYGVGTFLAGFAEGLWEQNTKKNLILFRYRMSLFFLIRSF